MSIRAQFVERFGEEQAQKIEAAAEGHKNGIHDKTGSDPFKWALAICIGFQCFEKDGYREYHGITAPFDDLKQWIKTDGHLDTHDGDVDFLGMFAGVYDEYMPAEQQ